MIGCVRVLNRHSRAYQKNDRNDDRLVTSKSEESWKRHKRARVMIVKVAEASLGMVSSYHRSVSRQAHLLLLSSVEMRSQLRYMTVQVDLS